MKILLKYVFASLIICSLGATSAHAIGASAGVTGPSGGSVGASVGVSPGVSGTSIDPGLSANFNSNAAVQPDVSGNIADAGTDGSGSVNTDTSASSSIQGPSGKISSAPVPGNLGTHDDKFDDAAGSIHGGEMRAETGSDSNVNAGTVGSGSVSGSSSAVF